MTGSSTQTLPGRTVSSETLAPRRLPFRFWFRVSPRAGGRLAWTRFYSEAQIASGYAAQDCIAAARREYSRATGFFGGVAESADSNGPNYNPQPLEAK